MTTMRTGGRPPMYDSAMIQMDVRVPRAWVAALDELAGRTRRTRSEAVRDILAASLSPARAA